MATSRKVSKTKKTRNTHGGARPGAGRPKKNRAPKPGDQVFASAEDYLAAVVRGEVEPDAVRVRAATTLIRYQETHKRAPKKNPTPTELDRKERQADEVAVVEDFETKAREIRARHKERMNDRN